jgi:4-hydroxy-2-oxoheptanedioate aldolase
LAFAEGEKAMFKENPVKKKMKSGMPTTCMFLRFICPDIAELMAISGVDYIIIDTEHFPFNLESIINCIRAAEIHNVPCIIRVADADHGFISRLLDMGALGILLAHADSYEKVKEAVDAVKFYPAGHRGFGDVTRGGMYGKLATPSEFTKIWNEVSMVHLMIEDKAGYENLDKILSIPEVDVLTLGAADFACSYGMPGDFFHPEMVKLHDEIRRKTIAAGKIFCDKGYTAEETKKQLAAGTLAINVGADTVFLNHAIDQIMKPIKSGMFLNFKK